MRPGAVRRYLLRRGLQVLVLSGLFFLYLLSGRMGNPSPSAYVAALEEETKEWKQTTRFACLVPELFELGGDWQRSPYSPAFRDRVGEAGWEFYEDTLPADSSAIIWRTYRSRPATLEERLRPGREESLGHYLQRFLPGVYYIIPIGQDWRYVLGPGAPFRVAAPSWISEHLVRCFLSRCEVMESLGTLHLDGHLSEPEGFLAGEVGTCRGTMPVPAGNDEG